MPLVKIEPKQGYDLNSILILRDTVMDAVVDTLQLPANDKNIRITEYKPELFLIQGSLQNIS